MVFDRPIQAGATLPQVRIGLLEKQQTATVTISQGSYNIYNAKTGDLIVPELQPLKSEDAVKTDFSNGTTKAITVTIKKSGGSWGTPTGTFSGPIELRADGTSQLNLITVNGKRYRGSMIILINNGQNGLNIINELPVEEYLYGVVPAEMPTSWPLEALKAQAVAARTFTATRMNTINSEGFHLFPDQRSQAYGGYNAENSRSNQAINETVGNILIDINGRIVTEALYHSNSGGHTENSENVWSSAISYLKGKEDPYSMGYGLSNWNYATSMEQIRGKVDPNGTLGIISSITLDKYQSGRVKNIIFKDTNGNTITKTGSAFGYLFNPGFYTNIGNQYFMSRLFDLNIDPNLNFSVVNGSGQTTNINGKAANLYVIDGTNQVTNLNGINNYTVQGVSAKRTLDKKVDVVGHGWGHGVGMSQWGAYGMAQQGKNFKEILTFYYTGTTVR